MVTGNCEQIDNMINRVFRDCQIKEKIAIGGFGTVYKAIDRKLGATRAIKIFHPHLSEEKGFRKRFEVEMRTLAQLDHVNIVRIIGAIEEPDVTGFIMEYIEGEPLNEIIENQGALSIPKVKDIFTQLGRAIAYAHSFQIIHRDLSPDNVIIRPDGVVKIMDFGIAKAIGSKQQEKLTQAGIVLGKPIYMAPEQFEGEVNKETDQYALGVILYELSTGRVPFDAESAIALYKLHLNEDPVPPRERNKKIPKYLENTILKSLSKEPDDRFDGVDEMVQSLLCEEVQGEDKTAKKVADLMFQINKAVDQEDFEQALKIVEEILIYDPDNKNALIKQEEILKLHKRHQDQDAVDELFYQAQEFHKDNMYEEARNSIVEFLKIASQYKESNIVKDYNHKLRLRMPKVYSNSVKIIEQERNEVKQFIRQGKTSFKQDDYKKALYFFEKALDLEPRNDLLIKLQKLTGKKIKMAQIAAYYKNAIIAFKNKNYTKAIENFDNILNINPNHKKTKKNREIALKELKRVEESRSLVETSYQDALKCYENWNFTEAIQKFEKVVELDSRHEKAHALLHESRARVADENKIEEIGFFYNQGISFYKNQQLEKAITCFDKVLKYMEYHKGALEHKRLAEEKMEEQAKIKEIFEEALELFRNSNYSKSLEKLEYILSENKNHKGAKQYKNLCLELQGIENKTTKDESIEDLENNENIDNKIVKDDMIQDEKNNVESFDTQDAKINNTKIDDLDEAEIDDLDIPQSKKEDQKETKAETDESKDQNSKAENSETEEPEHQENKLETSQDQTSLKNNEVEQKEKNKGMKKTPDKGNIEQTKDS